MTSQPPTSSSDDGPAFIPPTLPEPPRIPDELTKPVDHPILRRQEQPKALAGLAELGPAISMGLDFLFTIASGGFLGWLFDYWRATQPIGTLVGLSIGFAYATYRIIRRSQRDDVAQRRGTNNVPTTRQPPKV